MGGGCRDRVPRGRFRLGHSTSQEPMAGPPHPARPGTRSGAVAEAGVVEDPRFLGHHAAEDAQVAHAGRVRREKVIEHRAQIGLRVGPMVALPLPEKFLDLRHVRAAGNVLDRLVVNRHHGRAHERLALGVGQLDLDLGLLARTVGRGRGDDLHVEHAFLGRDGDLPDFGVDAAVGHRHRLDEEVGHVLLGHLDFRQRALAVHADHLRRR